MQGKLSTYKACCGAHETREIAARLSCNAAISEGWKSFQREPKRVGKHEVTMTDMASTNKRGEIQELGSISFP